MTLLPERYTTQIAGVLSCHDRISIADTLPDSCFAEGNATYLRLRGIPRFDHPRFAEPLREEVRQSAEQIVLDTNRWR